ncbi:MAG: ExbD/TolR family protein [Saprospiraceae bacterium]|jgi:biopolymer transport protein ExbD
MKLRKIKKEGAEVAAEAMNDIMFFLMLFFLIVSTLANPNVIKLAVPNSKAKKELNKKNPLILQAQKDGDGVLYMIDAVEVSKSSLATRLEYAVKGMEDPIVVLRASDDLTIQDLVDVLSMGEKLKIKMIFSSPAG